MSDLPDLASLAGLPGSLDSSGNLTMSNSQLFGQQIQDVLPGSSINTDGTINQGYSSAVSAAIGSATGGVTSSISSFFNYIETNAGNFATRIGVVILGFIFIAVALNMFAGKTTIVNNIKSAIK